MLFRTILAKKALKVLPTKLQHISPYVRNAAASAEQKMVQFIDLPSVLSQH
jgi:hypothetical protein